VNDGETRIYRAGESWSEPPGAIHSIITRYSPSKRYECRARLPPRRAF
jgi:hypothetical protein